MLKQNAIEILNKNQTPSGSITGANKKSPTKNDGDFMVRREGIEPSTSGLKGPRSTTELPAQIFSIKLVAKVVFTTACPHSSP